MNFLSCDWGTTHFRLRWLGGPATAEVCTEDGAAKLAAAGGDRAAAFRATLARGLAQLGAPVELPVVISGMASSTLGWRELPYARLPFALDGRDAVWAWLEERVLLISGFRGAADMVRGEETQALGLAATLGDALPARAQFILPGTHSKHLTVVAGEITGVTTYLTGELFDLLTRHSVLRHSTDPTAPLERTAFLEGVGEAQRRPLSAALFRVRTRQVLDQQAAPANAAFLSGLLIGAELATVAATTEPVIVAASGALRAAYTLAAEAWGLSARWQTVAAEPLAARGQAVLLRHLLDSGKAAAVGLV
jgi:2-dehydro-3-deoxygalactonokinase